MDARTRHTLVRLGTSYALAWATTSMAVGAGSAAIVNLTGNVSHAGLYVALFNVAAATGSALGGRAMDRWGRKPPLVAAYSASAIGFIIAGVAVSQALLAMFVVGTFLFAMAFGTANLSRLAAAEMFPPAERGRGVAWIQISATFGAIVGPLLLVLSGPLGALAGRAPLSLVWFFAPPLLIASALTMRTAVEPRSLAVLTPVTTGASVADAAAAVTTATGAIVAGTVSLAASQAAMAAVMGVSGAAIAHAGHGVPVLGSVMFLHFIGMFGLSHVVGRIVDKVGRRPTIFTGLALLALGGATVAVVPGAIGFGIGLLLVGLGWSFGFIGATVLLTDATPPDRRARVLGRADLTGQLGAAALAAGSGWWFAARGVAGLGVVAIVVAAVPVVVFAWVGKERPSTA